MRIIRSLFSSRTWDLHFSKACSLCTLQLGIYLSVCLSVTVIVRPHPKGGVEGCLSPSVCPSVFQSPSDRNPKEGGGLSLSVCPSVCPSVFTVIVRPQAKGGVEGSLGSGESVARKGLGAAMLAVRLVSICLLHPAETPLASASLVWRLSIWVPVCLLRAGRGPPGVVFGGLVSVYLGVHGLRGEPRGGQAVADGRKRRGAANRVAKSPTLPVHQK
jgi:hypothetical protein